MGFAVKAEIEGVRDLVKQLETLQTKVRKKTLRKMVTGMAKVVNKGMKRRAPRRTKTLSKSIGQRVKVYRQSGNTVAIVGPRKGFAQVIEHEGKAIKVNPEKYAHLVEFGTKHSRAKSFARATIEEDRHAILSAAAGAVREGLA